MPHFIDRKTINKGLGGVHAGKLEPKNPAPGQHPNSCLLDGLLEQSLLVCDLSSTGMHPQAEGATPVPRSEEGGMLEEEALWVHAEDVEGGWRRGCFPMLGKMESPRLA